jgi:hypothetical protein
MPKLTIKHVRAIQEEAVARINRMSQHAKLPGSIQAISERERVALAYFEGVLMVLGSLGVDTSSVEVSVSTATSDIETED